MSQAARADLILHALERKHRAAGELFFTEVKCGPQMAGTRRIDAVAVKPSWAKPCITAYEVKVSRSDFTGDDKWPEYLDYCHRFYFACPSGLIAPNELPNEVGLYWYDPHTGVLRRKRQASHRLTYRSAEMLYYLVIWRSDSERHPFFSSTREQIEAWLADRQERLVLARRFQSRLIEEARAAADLRRENEVLRKELEEAQNRLQAISGVLRKFGVDSYYTWDIENKLRRLIAEGVSTDVQTLVRRLQETIDQLAARLRGEASA